MMGDLLTLDDGRYLSEPSIGISGFLWLVAEHLPPEQSRLERWLRDVSKRTNGLMGIDLRGLPDDSRKALHEAARAAYDNTIGRGREITPRSYASRTLNRFMEARQSILRDDPPSSWPDGVDNTEAVAEDLDEIWFPTTEKDAELPPSGS